MRYRQRLWTCAAAGLLAGCSSTTFSSERLERARNLLLQEYALWTDQGITTYEYHFLRFCPCVASLTQPMVVNVADAAIVSVIYADSGTAVPDSAFASFFTVEGLFQQVQTAIGLGVDSLVIEYDPVMHYPTKLVVDQDRTLLNDELAWFASDLIAKE